MLFCRLLIFFSKLTFSEENFRNTFRVLYTFRLSNRLDPDQAQHFVGKCSAKAAFSAPLTHYFVV